MDKLSTMRAGGAPDTLEATAALPETKTAGTGAAGPALHPGDPCPQCGRPLRLHQTGSSDLLLCADYPVCSFARRLPPAPVSTLIALSERCPVCGGRLEVKRGRWGIFIGCANYPACRHVVQDKKPALVRCPQCGRGDVVKRQSRQGRVFYGCTNYPSCDFTVPVEPAASPCPVCGFPLRYKKRVKAGIALYCANPLCASRRRRKQELIAPDGAA